MLTEKEAIPSAKLTLTQPNGCEQDFLLEKSTVVLGRGTTSDINLADNKVSRTHARLEHGPDGYTLVDSGSANGVSVNGERATRTLLKPGDIIGIGDSSLHFKVDTLAVTEDDEPIDSEADLDATLVNAAVPMTLTDTDVARLVVHAAYNTWEVPLARETLVIGRHASCDLVLDQEQASRSHARIERVGDRFRLRDLRSTNGTWLGLQRITERMLEDGDTLRIGNARLVFKSGFATDELTMLNLRLPTIATGRALTHPPVVFVPGMMGSELWRGSEQIWPNVKLLLTRPEVLTLQENDQAVPRGLVSELVIVPNLIRQQRYGRLGDYLEEALGYERNKDLLEFAYDFRQDIRLSAQKLAAAIDSWPAAGPITLIAHSLGCIVSRYYIERLGGKSKIGRLILLGGPHAGSPKVVSHLLTGPNLLPFGLMGDKLRQAMSTFPSVYQILPSHAFVTDRSGKSIDLLSDSSWLSKQQRPLLRNAKTFRRELGDHSSVPTVSIFGYGMKTATSIKVRRNSSGGWTKVSFNTDDRGDTTVPATSAVLAGSEIHPVQQHHGSLYVDNDVKMRLKLELTR